VGGAAVAVELGLGLPHHEATGSFVPCNLGLALVHPGKDSRFASAVGFAVAALAAVGLGLVALAILFNVDLGIIDRWLAPWATVPGLGAAAFQIASAGTVAFGLGGRLTRAQRFERRRFDATHSLASSVPLWCSPCWAT